MAGRRSDKSRLKGVLEKTRPPRKRGHAGVCGLTQETTGGAEEKKVVRKPRKSSQKEEEVPVKAQVPTRISNSPARMKSEAHKRPSSTPGREKKVQGSGKRCSTAD